MLIRSEMERASLALFFVLLCLGAGYYRSEAQKLPPGEVEALQKIAQKLNKKDWDFKVDPCKGAAPWITPTQGLVANNVTCDCTFNSSAVCHVTSINLKGQNLTGPLPDEFAQLTFLRELDLSRNVLNGSIPVTWASLPLTILSVLGNRISGVIPKELGKMIALVELILESNLIEGPLPPELGNLRQLKRFLVSSNNFNGTIPMTYAGLTSLTDFRIDGNDITGKIPDFISKWTNLRRLDLQGTSLEGPIPSAISNVESLVELRITDLRTPAMTFPLLEKVDLKALVLRNCSLTGEMPSYIGTMKNLKTLDVSFNKLTGEIPSNLEGLSSIDFMFLTNNLLTGSIPSWILRSKRNLDVSFNNFTTSPPAYCSQGNVNLAGSFSDPKNGIIRSCLNKNFPCDTKPQYTSLFINCGGKKMTIGDKEYDHDSLPAGTSTFFTTDRWAFSSTGSYVGNDDALFIAQNTSALIMKDQALQGLYTTARLSPLSLKYIGFCLQNGDYSVDLHFAEIIFTNDQTFASNGRRFFDVIIQGVTVLKDFNIEEKAAGAGRPIVMNFNTKVTDNTLEIGFYWAGKGTAAIPERGAYGPLISAIAVTPAIASKAPPRKL